MKSITRFLLPLLLIVTITFSSAADPKQKEIVDPESGASLPFYYNLYADLKTAPKVGVKIPMSIQIENVSTRDLYIKIKDRSEKSVADTDTFVCLEPKQIYDKSFMYDATAFELSNSEVTFTIVYCPMGSQKLNSFDVSLKWDKNHSIVITPKPTVKVTSTPTPTSEWPSLKASSVKYNYANSVGKDFYLSGYGELTNYFNYAYDDYEEDYFCMRVTADDGSYDTWYIYFHRNSFEKVYELALQNGKVKLEMKCNITEYQKGQDDMAQALRVRWWN